MEVCPYSYFWWCGYFQGPWVSFFTWWVLQPYYQNDVNQITLNNTTLWNLALWIFEVFLQVLLDINLSLNQTLLIFLLSVIQTWITHLILTISMWRISSFNLKGFCYSCVWSCSLCEGMTSFWVGLIPRKLCKFSGLIPRKLYKFLYMFSTEFTSLSVLFLFPLSITFFVFIFSFMKQILFHLTNLGMNHRR